MRKTLDEKIEAGRVMEGALASLREWGPTGLFNVQGPAGARLTIVASDGTGGGDDKLNVWEHVSVSTAKRCPNWPEMCWVKDHFWEDEEVVFQLHPPKSTYISNHPYCLHLWRNVYQEFPSPPSIAVGIKEAGELKTPQQAVRLWDKMQESELKK